jgi:glycosyltransferase involved in cell wall biosynthesis
MQTDQTLSKAMATSRIDSELIDLSVVIPMYNEEQTLPELWRRLESVLSETHLHYEVIFVDDGSTDGTTAAIRELCQIHPQVQLIRLSRNFGHQPALTAGMDMSRGKAVVLMDGDLQDAPEAIPAFLEARGKGAEVAYAVRTKRRENPLMRLAFKSFYRLLGQVARISLPLDAGIFCLLDRRVVNVLKSMPEHNRYFPGLRAYTGFRQIGIPVQREGRYAGKPRVGIRGLFKLALDALFSFSFLPLRLATFTGLLVALGAFCYLVIVLYWKLFTIKAISGWASTLGAILLFGGLQLTMLGIVGEYIGRIYEETKKRPYYIIAETFNRRSD